jgi:predicted dehydrogenase
MKKALKVGFIGSGFISRFHAQGIAQMRGLEITGVVSKDKVGAESFAALSKSLGTGDCKIYSSIVEMAKNVDVVALYSPNDTRIEVMETLLSARKQGAELKGVLCEKPLGRNLAEARKIVSLAKEAQLLTAYFENQIHMKPIQVQKTQLQLQERTMGSLTLTRSAEEHGGPHNSWFWDPRKQGGGVLSDMGCHSIAVGWYLLTPTGKPLTYLKPQSVSCELGLLKWGLPVWRQTLKERHDVDYSKTPAEDFATGVITYKNPDTGQLVKSQFTDSWMFEKQGLRLFMDGTGPGYAFEINTLISPLSIFISDAAKDSIGDQELALEKSTASRGLLAVQYNEADLYGYTDENRDAFEAFSQGRDALLSFDYGLEITKLVMASYMAAEKRKTLDLTDPKTLQELETYIPLIQQGRGAEVLY